MVQFILILLIFASFAQIALAETSKKKADEASLIRQLEPLIDKCLQPANGKFKNIYTISNKKLFFAGKYLENRGVFSYDRNHPPSFLEVLRIKKDNGPNDFSKKINVRAFNSFGLREDNYMETNTNLDMLTSLKPATDKECLKEISYSKRAKCGYRDLKGYSFVAKSQREKILLNFLKYEFQKFNKNNIPDGEVITGSQLKLLQNCQREVNNEDFRKIISDILNDYPKKFSPEDKFKRVIKGKNSKPIRQIR